MRDFRLRIVGGGKPAGALTARHRPLGGIAAILVGALMMGGVSAVPALAAPAGGGVSSPVWTIVRSANARVPQGWLAAVSCAGRAACTAVGAGGDGAIAQTWNGRRWVIHPVPGMAHQGGLVGVSCWRPTGCVAIGADGGTALAFRWDGRRWHRMALPRLADPYARLDSVSCRSARFCVATGTYTQPRHPNRAGRGLERSAVVGAPCAPASRVAGCGADRGVVRNAEGLHGGRGLYIAGRA